ncbi:MAG TPA: guanylate kinase [Verrucomicrobiota bacterium]|nr:guanylate kinase [Verrucomicrobiales bacterium]HRI16360.1 guanylate kinase [Verrucomicrobiota bacterium]
MGSPLVLLISAPSGAGKTTVGENLLHAVPRLRRVVTCTTREPRPGEAEGVDYHFLTADQFSERVARREFLEHALVYGKSYGTLKASVVEQLNAGLDVLLIIDVQGAAAVRSVARADPILTRALVTVFLTPPTLSELERRLRGRAEDPEESLHRRLAAARAEAARWREFDYLVVSGTREEDLRRILAIYEAETLRRDRQEFQLAK